MRGVRWGGGQDTVFLLHEPGSDLDAWGTLPVLVAGQLGVETVALDLPGHGLSDEPWEPARMPDLLRDLSHGPPSLHHPGNPSPHSPLSPSQWERGSGGEGSRRRESDYPDSAAEFSSNSTRRYLIAAGISATSALAIASELQLSGLVSLTLEAPSPGGNPARSPTVPKLFIAGSMAGDDLGTARRLSAICGGWSVVTALPVSVRGTALLDSAWGGNLAEAIVAFLRDCQRPPRQRARHPDNALKSTDAR